jgi:prolyl oligopeptidase
MNGWELNPADLSGDRAFMFMPKKLIFRRSIAWVAVLALIAGCVSRRAKPSAKLDYPKAKVMDHVDDFGGVKVADPYRWLEDENSAETKAWIEAENKLTFSYLDQIPERAAIREKLSAVWNYERYGIPVNRGGRYFFTKNDGLQNQSVLYWAESLAAEPRVLLDPNVLAADGTVALSGTALTDDGKWLAYGVSASGSDWQEWHVRSVDTGKDTADLVRWVKFSTADWTRDGRGFFYSRYDEPAEKEKLQGQNYNHKLYFHKVGDPQSADQLVYARPDHKEWGFAGGITEDGRYLIISISRGTEIKNALFYKDLKTAGSPVVELLKDFDAEYDFISNDGPIFWFKTDEGAPRGRVIAIDTGNPDKSNWRELIPESLDKLEAVSAVNEFFIARYLKDARSQVKLHSLDGKFLQEIVLPGLGTASGFGGLRKDQETFYAFTSYTTPSSIYRLDLPKRESSLFKRPTVAFRPEDYETKQVFYRSRDGTRVPMFLTSKKGVRRDGPMPTYLYAYGGFDISLTPAFAPSALVWMQMGGLFAVANLRGGGEYGKEWHEAGMKERKQNVFDDFIAAAEWLIQERYTSREKLAIGGASNGGLLVGACLTQRPDLYGAALPAVGVMDMLRFDQFTIGWAWTSEFGTPTKPDEFPYIYRYSPYHRIKEGTRYPATLVTTGDHDDRVVPAHSFKFAARLQAAQGGEEPVLIRIETKAGHGAGKPTAKQIEEAVDRWAFLVKELGMRPEWETRAEAK